jgi:hypothetical protein
MALSIKKYVSTAEAVERILEVRDPEIVAGAPERESELRRLVARYRADFPGVGAPPARLADAIRAWEVRREEIAVIQHMREDEEAVRSATSVSEMDARLAEAKQRYADIVSARWSGTFSEGDLARLHELERIEQDRGALRDGAARELRSALVEGHLNAFLSGDTSPIPRSRWRRSDALDVLESRPGGQGEGGVVVMKEADFVAWLHPKATGALSDGSFAVIKNLSGGGRKVRTRVETEMYQAITTNSITLEEFRGLPQRDLATRFGASRQVATPAREMVLARLETEVRAKARKNQ